MLIKAKENVYINPDKVMVVYKDVEGWEIVMQDLEHIEQISKECLVKLGVHTNEE